MPVIEEIRPYETAVIGQVAAMEQETFPDPWTFEAVKSTVEQNHTFCAVEKDGDKVTGYYLCYYVLDECEIARIAVSENVRRRGVGQKLLNHMEMICREKGITRILLDVRKSNRTAAAFYRKNGFCVDGERKDYYAGACPEDAVLMSKTL